MALWVIGTDLGGEKAYTFPMFYIICIRHRDSLDSLFRVLHLYLPNCLTITDKCGLRRPTQSRYRAFL